MKKNTKIFVAWLDLPPRQLLQQGNPRYNWTYARNYREHGLQSAANMMQIKTSRIPVMRDGKPKRDKLVISPRPGQFLPGWREATIKFTFHLPWRLRNGRRDVLNYVRAMKPAVDGIVDAGVLLDDDKLTPLRPKFVYDKGEDFGAVRIEIKPKKK